MGAHHLNDARKLLRLVLARKDREPATTPPRADPLPPRRLMNARRGGYAYPERECTVGTWVGATVGGGYAYLV